MFSNDMTPFLDHLRHPRIIFSNIEKNVGDRYLEIFISDTALASEISGPD